MAEPPAKFNPILSSALPITPRNTRRQLRHPAVQEQEILQKEKELEATVVKPANAQRTAQILQAEAAQQAAVLEAEGKKMALMAIAEAEQERGAQGGRGPRPPCAPFTTS